METIDSPLKTRWDELKTQEPAIRIRNAAVKLGVSEEELLATVHGDNVVRLEPLFKEILGQIESLGKVMALTRNNSVVHERKGIYLNPTLSKAPVGLFVGEDIDLRIFFQSWKSAYSVTEMTRGKERRSLQFFAKDGEAIHKIYIISDAANSQFDQLVLKFKANDQSNGTQVEQKQTAEAEQPDNDIDTEALRKGWLELKDTHSFFPLLTKHKVTRTQALRLAPEGNYAIRVKTNALRLAITKAAANETPIMVFVGNQGMIQIHTGPVNKLLDHEGWFNIMDPDFNLHVKEADIKEAWVVRKPSVDGIVTALEFYDETGTQIVQLFGKRKPGIPELEAWREIVKEVELDLKID